jgi:hypothetical protein
MDLGNLDKWTLADGQRMLVLAGKPASRRIRLDLNASHETGVYIYAEGAKDPQFLANVKGRHTVQFRAGGTLRVAFAIPNGGQCWYNTMDGETVHFELPDAESFTRVWQRKPRNHDLEVVMHRMARNQEAMLSQLQAESDRRLAALEKRLTTKPNKEPKADADKQRASDGDGGKDAGAKGGTDGGKKADGAKAPQAKAPSPGGADDDGSGS